MKARSEFRPTTRPRPNPYMYATWIARYLVGEKSCQWAAWFKTNNQGFDRVPSTFDSARWNMEHTDLLNELADRLDARGCRLYIERQNEFKTESPNSGLVIHGRPDIIAVDPEGRATIYDVKTGQESDSHVAQVQIYICTCCPGRRADDGAARPSTAGWCIRTARRRRCRRPAWTGRS